MNRTFLRWQNFKRKAVTLSYDDGVKADIRLIEILNKYGLKGTFNICSGQFAQNEDSGYITEEKARELYAYPHEVAVHGVKHLSLAEVDTAMGVNDIVNDRKNLERIFGKIVKGMAYANGSYSDKTVQLLKNCGISYARTVDATKRFDIPTDWLRMPTTCHHNDPSLMELAKQFVETKDLGYFWRGKPMLFYLWGHSYEFNNNNNWHVIEEFAKYVGNRDDIWYATNGEIYEYVQAYDRLEFSADGSLIHNPSAIDVYICYFRKEHVIIPAGQTVAVDTSY